MALLPGLQVTVSARIGVIGHLAVRAILLPAGFHAAGLGRVVQATGAINHFPARVESQVIEYGPDA